MSTQLLSSVLLTLWFGAPDAAVTPRAVAPRPVAPRQVLPRKRPIAKPRLSRWPTRIGPFQLVSKKGNSRLTFGFAGQLQAELLVTDLGEDDVDDSLAPKLRRIRLSLQGSFLWRHLTYGLQLSTAPRSLEIMDFFLDYRFHRHLRVRAGQYKIPFSSHREGSFKTLTFVDWSLLVTAFGSERQLGVHLHNEGAGPSGWFYALGVFTGQNARAAHNRLYAATWGESLTNPSDLTDPAPLEPLHPELVARLAYKTGGINTRQDTDFRGGAPRVAATLGLAWDLNPQRYVDPALRGVAELLLKVQHASVHAALYLATARRSSRFSQRFAQLGGPLQASYLFAGRYELAARYAVVHLDQALLDDARLRAGRLIGAAPDDDARATLQAQYGAAGTVQREHEATLGFNLYVIRHDLKLQLDVSWLGHERAGGMLHDLRSRLQLQLAF